MPRRTRLTISLFLITLLLTTVVSCKTGGGSGGAEPTPTPIPPPPVPEKPTYTVKRGSVVDSLSFTGRVAPSVERELFFKESGRVKKVLVERNATVEAGALLAELENDDLVRQLTQADLSLETANLNLQNARTELDYSIQKVTIAYEQKKLQLAKLEASIAASDNKAEEVVARINLQRAENDYKLAQYKQANGLDAVAEARRRLEQAKNSRWASQANRDQTCSLGKSAGCDGANANVLNAELNVRQAEADLQAALAAPSDVESARLSLEVARANYAKTTSKSNTDQFDVEMVKLQLKEAELDLERAKRGLDPQLTKAVEQAKLSVERLKSQVDNTRAVSPIAGKVTSVSAYEGRAVEAYKAVFIVADETTLEITAEPMSSQLDKLTEGMDTAIILSSYPGKELKGKIMQLPYPYGTGGAASSEVAAAEGTDKLTHIQFDPEDLKLGPGDLVKVVVTLQRKDDVLWLPPAAIRTFSGRKFVVVEEEGRQRRVDITVGTESAERVEIKEGLQENQVVVGQ